MDHAGKELERSAKLLHSPVARAHDQAREIGIMQSQVVFYVDMQGKGKSPLPLHSIPKTNNNSKTKSNNKTKTKNKIKVVYTEDLTHPLETPLLPAHPHRLIQALFHLPLLPPHPAPNPPPPNLIPRPS